MTTKRCFKCLCEKPFEAFYKHSAMSYGRIGKCKECTKADVIKNRQDNLEKYRAYDRMRASMPHRVAARVEYQKTPAYAESSKESSKKWEARHPDRRKANNLVGNALRDKRLFKTPCHVCGEIKVEGHHPDYSRPLDVIWLCNSHHREIHKPTFETHHEHLHTNGAPARNAATPRAIRL